jgi:hypothetical protein
MWDGLLDALSGNVFARKKITLPPSLHYKNSRNINI